MKMYGANKKNTRRKNVCSTIVFLVHKINYHFTDDDIMIFRYYITLNY